jgi:chromosome segregation ATPase|tara:strand:+ start:296 stop:556 length:261 start_codon:yes stop_codon:yes gene_type:complete
MEFITDYWEQILIIGAAIIVATRLREQVNEARRDIDALTDQLNKRDTYVETVRLRAQFDAQVANLEKQVSALWDFCNQLRDRHNGK